MSGKELVTKWIRIAGLAAFLCSTSTAWVAAQAPHPHPGLRARAAVRHAQARHVHNTRVHHAQAAHAAHVARAHQLHHAQVRPRPRVLGPPIVVSPYLSIPTVVRTSVPPVRQTIVRSLPPVPGQPDLAIVDIQVEAVEADEDQNYVTMTLQNVGRGAYRSAPGRQAVALYIDGELAGQQEFTRLAVGETLEMTVIGAPDAEVYEARIVFADGIREDGNRWNDDANAQNNWLTR